MTRPRTRLTAHMAAKSRPLGTGLNSALMARVSRPGCEGAAESIMRYYRAPLVDGIPVTRASGATAARNARASALNCDSTMWCGSRPASTRM